MDFEEEELRTEARRVVIIGRTPSEEHIGEQRIGCIKHRLLESILTCVYFVHVENYFAFQNLKNFRYHFLCYFQSWAPSRGRYNNPIGRLHISNLDYNVTNADIRVKIPTLKINFAILTYSKYYNSSF